MSNVIQRILLFVVAVPLLVAVIAFLPQANHAATVAVVLVFCGGSAVELGRLFRQRGIDLAPAAYLALGLAAPLAAYAGCLFGGSQAAFPALAAGLGAATLAAFAPFALARDGGIEAAMPRAAALGFTILYPGLLGAFIVLVAAQFPRGTESMFSFMMVSFANDSLAWLAGVTVGRRRNLVAVSPNKSLAGFIAGMAGSVAAALLLPLLFEGAAGTPAWSLLALGLATGAADVFGDLFESALKRSAKIKDSGTAVPGRGGFLDSFDSLLFAAPVFYGISQLLGLFR